MTRRECEMALIQIGLVMKNFANSYAPNANHISINAMGDTISVTACEFDGDGNYVQRDILNASRFADGSMYIGGEYVQKGGNMA